LAGSALVWSFLANSGPEIINHISRLPVDVAARDIVFPGQCVKDALMTLPDQAAKDIEPQWLEEGENIRVADAVVVDIMLNANGQTYETLRRYSQTLDLDGVPVPAVNLEGLLLTKQTMRDKDALDRIVIERALAIFRQRKPEDELGDKHS
jgi:hypothetical protein